MSVLTQFGGGSGPVTSIQNSPVTGATLNAVASAAQAVTVLSGAQTAATLKDILSVSGRGRLLWVCAYANDATARTIRLTLTIDGTVVKDHTSGSISATNTGYLIVGTGHYTGSAGNVTYQPIDFTSQLLIRCASSLTETDKITIGYVYEVWA